MRAMGPPRTSRAVAAIGFCAASAVLCASVGCGLSPVRPVLATTYYVAPTGSDGSSRNGSSSQPWATLAYACTRVTTSGDVITRNAGTYNETQTSSLAAGVSLEGPTASPPTAIVRGWSGAAPTSTRW